MKKVFYCLILIPALFFVWNNARSQTFTFTCPTTTTTWTVPAGVTSILVDVQGASGGTAGTGLGATTPGKGGRTQATLAVVPGQILNIYVGGAGGNGNLFGAVGGFNGGGSTSGYGTWGGGGGGGASDIRIGGVALANRVIVGAGGGGAGYDGGGCTGDQPGGDGGGLTGGTVTTCVGYILGLGYSSVILSGGGTQVGGGVGGALTGGFYPAGSAGVLGIGGKNNNGGGIGGGGGGGYYGGGGGCWMGGGGGSSYTDPVLATATTLTSGFNTGCGKVVITVTCVAGTITGTGAICVGGFTPLTDATTGGTWNSSAAGVATVSATGVVHGLTPGTATISYTMPAGCFATSVVTVATTPITGATSICAGSTVALTDALGVGTWSSSATGVATIGSTTGLLNALSLGTTTISYIAAGGCIATTVFTVSPGASPISGGTAVCVGGVLILSDPPVGGTWSSSSPGNATVDIFGDVIGVSLGTAVITYFATPSCYTTTTINVISAPSAIIGPTTVCQGSTSSLFDVISGGIWSSSNTSVATVGSTGTLTTVTGVGGGVATITYSTGGSCFVTTPMTVTGLPGPITGTLSICTGGGTSNLTDAATGGGWSSSAPGIASVDPSGLVTGGLPGTATITYSTGCPPDATVVVTVEPVPVGITGIPTVCLGLTTNLTDTSPGGTWSTTSGTGLVTVDATGLVTGILAGTAIVSYSNVCATIPSVIVTVYPLPTAITGNVPVCIGATATLNSTPAGGTWTTAPGTGSVGVDPVTGVITGATAGTATVTYSFGGGCNAIVTVTVNPLPTAITGNIPVCAGLTITLNSTPAGGTWNTTPGTGSVGIGTGTGIMTGGGVGTATVTYSLAGGCNVTATVTVNSNPTVITGNTPVCVGLTATLNSTPAGGTWTTTAGTGSVSIGAGTGIITGSAAGNATVTYTLGTGCFVTATVTVNTVPTAITGNVPVCIGLTTTLNSTPAGGTWTTTPGTGSVGIGAGTGIITGGVAGNATVTYSFATGCNVTATVTVNSNPTAITGNTPVCVGLTATLNSTPAGGTWTTTAGTGSVGIGAGTGIITGGAAGNATVTYTLGTGCIVTATVTVNPNPTAIGGNVPVCIGLTTTLNSTPAGGTWITTAGTGSVGIGAGTGIITGGIAGNATVTYSLGTGCNVTATVTINSNPAAITGNTPVCVGLTATLNSTPAGGTWTTTAGTGSVGIGAGTGIITGGGAGNATVTYTLGTGCIVTATVTVNPNPTAITGNVPVCVGLTATLNSTPAGGTWTTTAGTGSVGIGAGTGIITGSAAGNATVTYTLGTGCIITATVTVNSNPTAITGNVPVCVGLTATLNSTPAGGTWTTTAGTGSIGIGAGTGIITGGGAGNATVTYTLGTGCTVTAIVTVNANPTAITGDVPVCVGLTATLNSTPAGGTWTTNAGTGSAGISGTGIITGGAAGNATVTYTLGTGCISTAIVTINANPTTITGATTICVGLTTTLNSTPAGGTWTSSNGNASAGAGTGIITGNIVGTATITYALSTGCITTVVVTVSTSPAAITGSPSVCLGSVTPLTDAGGGGWTSSNGNVSVDGFGNVSGLFLGTSTITYTIGGGCFSTLTVTVNPNPTAITGNVPVCAGLTATLNSTPAGGTWSTTAGTGSIGIGAGTGIITGGGAGNATAIYTLGTGCSVSATVTINPNPTAITGNTPVCIGLTTTLNSTPAGGTWSTAAGTGSIGINPGTGVVTGGTAGNATVTYTLGTGCIVTAIATVNANPAAITGDVPVCVGLTATLNSTPAGGIWTTTAGTGSVGIGAGTGIITGGGAGNATVTYTLGTGCIVTAIVTVNANPTAITGNTPVCVGLTQTLNSTPAGGTWTTTAGTGSVGIGAGTGIITGGGAGNATVTYTLGTGCIVTAIVTVNANPTAITGNAPVCVGLTATLNSTPAGGTWSATSGTGSVGIGAGSGIITGGIAGNATVTYTLGTGCITTAIATVNPNPTAITGSTSICVGSTTTLNSTPAGGTWASSNGNTSAGTGTGIISGNIVGTSTITYTIGTGCIATIIVTVNTTPTPITGPMNVCVGMTTTLNSTPGGGAWSTTAGTGSVGIGAGTGVVTGGTVGNATVTYSLGAGCTVTAIVTVNGNPTAITGNTPVCVGLTATLNSTPAGGTWSTTAGTGSVGIGAGTGIITGSAAGNATVTYTIGTGCYVTAIATVNPNPTAIAGNVPVCIGLTTTLNSTPAGGNWTTVAGTGSVGIGAGTGIITGGAAGNATVTYTLGTGCLAFATVTVNSNPTAITGNAPVCVASTVTLNSTPAGGTWSATSGTGSIGIGAGTGIVTGSAAGTATVTYTLGTGCTATAVVTINPLPAAIPGTLAVCVGSSVTLTDPTGGGSWTTTNGNAAIGGGFVNGVTAGTDGITYTLPTTCYITAIETINPLPAGITGTLTVCPGLTTALTDITPGGSWTSSASGTAAVGSTGVVTGGATAGTATITYKLSTGCIATAVVTDNPLPVTISGNLTVCIGLTTVLTDLSGGGTWSSSNGNTSVVSGTVSGIGLGTSVITYTLPTGCITTAVVTVNGLPVPIMGTLTVCSGLTTSLSDLPGGGAWNSSAPGTAGVGSSTGLVTGGLTTGTATITYTIGTGCITTAVVTVNPVPTGILGTLTVCVGLTTPLTDLTGGGTWSSSNPAAGTVSATGVVTGIASGTTVITYALATGCLTTSVVTVNALPSGITGTTLVCVGLTTALTDGGGGTWSVSPAGIASVSGAGLVTGGPGTGTVTITFTLPTSCIATTIVTVNPFLTAGAILGTYTVCPGATTTLIDLTAGGVWSSAFTGIATIGTSGIVTGIAAGTTTISYVVTNSCGSATTSVVVTVNSLSNPGVITGTAIVCIGHTSLLNDAVPGGIWSSAIPTIASISATGLLTGSSYGTTTISYQTTNICGAAYATVIASVNPAPNAGAILGAGLVCPGTSITLSDPSSGGGGVWSSASPGIATIGSSTGTVTGVAAGNAVITYAITNSCATAITTANVTVHAFPKIIMGDSVLCQGNSIFLSDSVSGGVWSSSNTVVADVAPVLGTFPTAAVSGISVGTAVISYVVAPACFAAKTVTVNPLAAITAASQMCIGSSQTAADLPAGGTWSTSTPGVAIVGSSSGIVSAIASGAATITYVLSPGCFTTTPVTVNVLPDNFFVTGGGTYCPGGTGVDVGLDGSTTGATYQLILGGATVATMAGTGSSLDFGLLTAPGVYTVRASNDTTGCQGVMGSSATVTISVPAVPFVSVNSDMGTLICVGTLTTFSAVPLNGGPTPLYNWYVNGVSTSPGATYSYVPNNGDVVSVKLTSDATCVFPDTAIGSLIMTTTTGLTPTVALLVSPSDSVCTGTPVTLSPVVSFGGSSPVFSWIKNGVYEGGGLTYTFLPNNGDNVFCWMQSSITCSLADSVPSNNIVMTVSNINIPSVNLLVMPGNRIVAGETVTLVATVAGFGGTGLSYQWEIDSTPVPGATSDTFTSSSFTSYDSVTCAVTGYSICGSTTRDVSTIIIDTIATGVQTIYAGAGDVKLVPNPNNGTFTIKGAMGTNVDEPASLEITDMLGQEVYKKEVAIHNGRINEQIQLSASLANGVYLLNLKSGSDIRVFHFVIEQ